MGRDLILPDHLHFFAAATESTIAYDRWVTYWMSQFRKRHGDPEHLWQTDHWDTRIRNAERYEEKYEYVRSNPVRLGLVEKPEDWPYQGEIHELRWD